MTGISKVDQESHKQRISAEQLHLHYQQLPAVIIAPALGAIFTAWVLWDAVDLKYLKIGLIAVLCISLFRIFLYKWYFTASLNNSIQRRWTWFSVGTALVSGLIWGSAAIFLYPPLIAEYEIYMLVLLALVPIAPVASLAIYMPAFYAYYIPSIAPFIFILGSQDSHAETMTAVLLLMMMGATITFANKYSSMLAESIRLRLKLDDKKRSLEQLALEKTKFLAASSHDLRQPVHALGLFVESLLKKTGSHHVHHQLIKSIQDSTTNLRIMLDGMLDIARLDANIVDVNRQNIELGSLLESLCAEYRQQALLKGLSFHCVDTRLVINSDPVLLERILRNLLSNAIKYTDKGRILLGCRRHNEQVQVQVHDTGSGIPKNHIEDIFMEYTQLHSTQKNPKKGLGLGLSIIQRLAGLLEHDLKVKSQEGIGSVFSVSLPIVRGIPNDPKADVQKYPDVPLLHNKLIVVIDDDKNVRDAMLILLQEWGVTVLVFESVQKTIETLKKLSLSPVLLILDYHLSNENTAVDAIAQITNVTGEDVPVIVITGDTASERIKEAHNSGLVLLHKPVDPVRLKICMMNQLEMSGQ